MLYEADADDNENNQNFKSVVNMSVSDSQQSTSANPTMDNVQQSVGVQNMSIDSSMLTIHANIQRANKIYSDHLFGLPSHISAESSNKVVPMEVDITYNENMQNSNKSDVVMKELVQPTTMQMSVPTTISNDAVNAEAMFINADRTMQDVQDKKLNNEMESDQIKHNSVWENSSLSNAETNADITADNNLSKDNFNTTVHYNMDLDSINNFEDFENHYYQLKAKNEHQNSTSSRYSEQFELENVGDMILKSNELNTAAPVEASSEIETKDYAKSLNHSTPISKTKKFIKMIVVKSRNNTSNSVVEPSANITQNEELQYINETDNDTAEEEYILQNPKNLFEQPAVNVRQAAAKSIIFSAKCSASNNMVLQGVLRIKSSADNPKLLKTSICLKKTSSTNTALGATVEAVESSVNPASAPAANFSTAIKKSSITFMISNKFISNMASGSIGKNMPTAKSPKKETKKLTTIMTPKKLITTTSNETGFGDGIKTKMTKSIMPTSFECFNDGIMVPIATSSQASLINNVIMRYEDFPCTSSKLDAKIAGMRIFASVMLNAWRKRRAEVKFLMDEVDHYKHGCNKSKTRIQVLNTLFSAEQKRNLDLHAQLKKSLDEVKASKRSCEHITTSLISIKAEKVCMEQQLTIKDQEYESLNAIFAQTRSDLFQAMTAKRELNLLLSSEQRLVQTLGAQKEDMISEMEKMCNEHVLTERRLMDEVQKKSEMIVSLEFELEALKNTYENLTQNTIEMEAFVENERRLNHELDLVRSELETYRLKCDRNLIMRLIKYCKDSHICHHLGIEILSWILKNTVTFPTPDFAITAMTYTMNKVMEILKLS